MAALKPNSCLNHHHVGHAPWNYLLWKQYLQFRLHSCILQLQLQCRCGIRLQRMQNGRCNAQTCLHLLSKTHHVCLIVTEISRSGILLFFFFSGLPSGPNQTAEARDSQIAFCSRPRCLPSCIFNVYTICIYLLTSTLLWSSPKGIIHKNYSY